MDTNDPNYQDQRWVEVVGFDGVYEISNWGSVRSIGRTDMKINNALFDLAGESYNE